MRSVLCTVLDWFWFRFYVFYQRAHVVKANGKSFYIVFSFTLEWRLWLSKISGTYLSSWTLLTMMFAVFSFCCLLDCEQHVPSVGLRQRWLCQHPWLCAYLRLRASRCFSGLFCCRAPKRIIWCTSSTAATWTTMVFLFLSLPPRRALVRRGREMRVLRAENGPLGGARDARRADHPAYAERWNEREVERRCSSSCTSTWFAESVAKVWENGGCEVDFQSQGQFLRENLNIMSIFGLSLVEGLTSGPESESKDWMGGWWMDCLFEKGEWNKEGKWWGFSD